ANEPGSSMHIHQSVMSARSGRNVFAGKDGKPSKLFLNHIGGLHFNWQTAVVNIGGNGNELRTNPAGDFHAFSALF
ncbi:MAG: hypothetical protein ICV84_06930, partial [Flavisolibacter sp.]|nr:hypothetical protein [Flavisolibacter sp.]